MAIYRAFVKPRLSFAELLPALPPRTLAVRPDVACLKRFLDYTYSEAFKSFQAGRQSARKFEVEWLCRLACTQNQSKAIGFCRPRGELAALVSPEEIGGKIIGGVGVEAEFAPSPSGMRSLAGEYGFGSEALEKYSLEDLLVEKCAVEFLQ